MKTLLAFGASSAIVEAYLLKEAEENLKCHFILVGRDSKKLEGIRDNLVTRHHAQVSILLIDFLDFEDHVHVIDRIFSLTSQVDVAIFGQGVLGEQSELEKNFSSVFHLFSVNTLSVISLIEPLVTHLLSQNNPSKIAVITSVAADRGRAKNYIYGASKATLCTYLSGLRQRLAHTQIDIVDVRPGFVATQMTAHLPQGGPLFTTPELIAPALVRALRPSSKAKVVYLPGFWRWIMLVIRCLPYFVFHRLKF